MRCRTQGTWSQWKEISTDIPSFYKDYSTLFDLEGAISNASLRSISDWNDAPNGWFTSNNATNAPVSGNFTISGFQTTNTARHKNQIGFKSDGSIYCRAYNGGSWTDWKSVSLMDV